MKLNYLLVAFLALPFLLTAQKLKSITKKFPNQKTIEIEYTVLKKKKYVKHGEYKKYFEDGQLKEIGEYDNNKKHGDWKEYNYHGQIRRIRKYDKGRLISDEKFGIWKESGTNGRPYFYDYDKKERVMPQIPILVEYPIEAREEGIAGIVKIKVELDEQCELKEIKVVKSLRIDFDKEAIKGVENFIEKLKYFKNDCKEFEEVITIEFKID
jgi:TonB family protein